MPVIAVDAMGGDHAPDEIVRGVADVSLDTDIDCLLVGDESRVQALLEQGPYNPERIAVLHARDSIAMDEDAHEAVRAHKDASLLVALRAVASGRADAIVSAGNTGACVLAAAKHFALLPGVKRAALACVHPRMTEYPGQDPLALLLDVGATVRCEADELLQFALMGSAYARRISKVPNPRVGLLNMGREDAKGGATLVEANHRLRAQPMIDFVGNVEGNDLVRGMADVIVCEASSATWCSSCWKACRRCSTTWCRRPPSASWSGASACGCSRRASSACKRSPTSAATAARRSSASTGSSSSATGAPAPAPSGTR